MHILRHHVLFAAGDERCASTAIQELNGHADLTTTQRYMHLSPAATEDAIRLLDGRDAGAVRAGNFGDILDTGRETAHLRALRYGGHPSPEMRAKGGAGYGDRTRLTGLGSQDITTMLSPHSGTFELYQTDRRGLKTPAYAMPRFLHSVARGLQTARSRPNEREHLITPAFHLRERRRFEVQADQRLGVRRAHVEVPVRVFH